ncbi:MAG TPA: MOP flippase family protein [Longimicrobiales bacterium]
MSLKQAAFTAARWTAIGAVVRSALQFGQVVVLTRLLVPEDFGLMAVAVSVMGFAGIISDLGVSSAIIHRQDTTADQLSTLYWVNVASGIGVMLLVVGVSPLVAGIYGDARLRDLLLIAALSFPVLALGQQLRVRAEKELRFGAVALMEIGAATAGFVVTIALALAGFGVMSLVAGLLANAVVATTIAWLTLAHGWRPGLAFDLRGVRHHLSFGGYMIGNNLTNTVTGMADVLIGGRVLGPALLGLFSVPRNFVLQTQWLINPVVTRIAFPVMAKVQDDVAALRMIYLNVLRLTVSATAPLYVFMMVFAPELTLLLFGERWAGAASLLRLLALWGLLRAFANPVGSLLMATGRARLSFQWNVGMVVVVPLVLFWGASLGVVGLAASWVALGLITFVPTWYVLVRPCCGATLAEYTAQGAVPAGLALAAGAAAYAAALPFEQPLLRVAVALVTGGAVYVAGSVFFNRAWTEALRALLRFDSAAAIGAILPARPAR